MEKRYLENLIIEDAFKSHKIAFISGPRQVGKTTMAKSLLRKVGSDVDSYFNWDDDEFKKLWIKSPKIIIENTPSSYFCFDEIHKDRNWKNKLKGLYDIYGEKVHFMVTGSARLDYYRKSGDSLQGRYFPYRLHPFSLAESSNIKPPPVKDWFEHKSKLIADLKDLEKLGGFPEPLWGQNFAKAARWRKLYRERLIKEDAREIENVKEIQNLDVLSLLLEEKASGQLSYSSLREDIGSSHDSITRWIGILETLYYCYRIRPYSKSIKNSIKKEPKLYLYDWARVEDEGARFENLIAGHLLKNVQLWTDAAIGEFDLFYVRDKQKREVDFLVTKNKKPWLLLEVKSQNSTITPALSYYNNLLKPDFCFQLVKNIKHERGKSMAHPGIQVVTAERFLGALN